MTFPTNTSPYGVNKQFQTSPMGGPQQAPSGGNSFFQALFGKPERNYQQSTLGPEQQPGYQQLLRSIQERGAGGAFGESADYYRDLLDPNSETANAMFAPEQRRFNEDIIPKLAEQFSGYGGIGSSGFRNAAINAGTDLSERLGAIRAQLRQQAAQGLSNIGTLGLNTFNENIHRPETFGLLGNLAEGAGKSIGSAVTSGATSGISSLIDKFKGGKNGANS